MFNRLYAKLAAGLLLVFVLVGALVLWVTRDAMDRYSQAVTQQMNASVAMYVSNEQQLIADGVANIDALKQLAHHAMIINPSIEVYLLDRTGRILSHDLPVQQVVRKAVDLEPVRTFLQSADNLPLLGDDPGSLESKKVFSASEVRFDGKLEGYVYIVLEGRQQELLEQSIFQHHVFRLSAAALAGSLAFGGAAALLLFYWFTRRIRSLSARLEQFYGEKMGQHSKQQGDELECLESAFAAMQERIRNQVQQIRQSDEMRRELIANISHDLRTPLTNMLGYIETLLLKGESLAPAQQQQYLEITRNHGQKLGRLIADLFELAKLDGGAVQAQRETFSIAELIHDVVQDFTLQAERNQIRVQVQGDLDQAWVCADIRLMERVLENLLDNALRHTPRGGQVDVMIHKLDSGVRVRVSDNGEGIAPDDLPYIFDRFYHARDSGQASMKSTGLGLAIVKRILDLHRSTIDVTSHLSQGTTFEFMLSR